MAIPHELRSLVDRYEDLKEQGCSPTPEEVCQDCPHLLAAFRRAVRALDQLSALYLRLREEQQISAEQATLSEPRTRTLDTLPIRIPGYEILGELGRGGMGVVYKARQTKPNRVVALKMILAGSQARAAELARFQAEAEAIAGLQHPNIVQVHEVGEHDGKPFFSMEHCSAGSLAQRLNGTPMKARDAATLVETLASAVKAAHHHRIIHRDLKPGNILFAEDGTPKITDFGLAKKLDEEGHTKTGMIVGTPSYMAPEQAGGGVRAIGPAVDVYALGAILYELLTGRPPFKGATTMDTLNAVQHDDPVPPRRLQPGTPRDLETICLKCLRKEPAKRYNSAQELAEDLRRFMEDRPIHARPIGSVERTTKWVRRHPARATLVAVLALFLLAFIGLLEKQRADLTTQRDSLTKQRDDLLADVQRQHEQQSRKDRRGRYDDDLPLALNYYLRGDLANAAAILQPYEEDEDLHDFSYRFLRQLLSTKPSQPYRVVGGRLMATGCFVVAPDGHTIVLADRTGSVRRIDAAKDGADLGFLCQPRRPTDVLASSPDGAWLATTGSWASFVGGTVAVWDARTGAWRGDLNPRDGALGAPTSLAFHPTAPILAASYQMRLVVWDVQENKTLADIPVLHRRIGAITFTSDGATLAAVCGDELILFDWREKKERTRLRHPSSSITAVATLRKSNRLVSVDDFGEVALWNAADNKPLRLTEDERLSNWMHHFPVYRLAVSPDESWLATLDTSGFLLLREADTLRLRYGLRSDNTMPNQVAFTGDNRLVLGGGDGGLQVLDLKRRTINHWGSGVCATIHHLAFTDEGRTLVGGCSTMPHHLDDFVLLGNAGRNSWVLSGSSNDPVIWWDAMTGEWTRSLPRRYQVAMTCMDLSPDGKQLALGWGTRIITPVRLDQSTDTPPLLPLDAAAFYESSHHDGVVKLLGWVPEHPQPLPHAAAVVYSPDGRLLAAASSAGALKLWEDGHERTPPANEGAVTGLVFSPDGSRLAINHGGRLRLWSVAGAHTDWAIDASDRPIQCVAFAPKAPVLATGGVRGEIRLWSLDAKKEIATLLRHINTVAALAYSPNGRTLASGGYDSKVILWNPATGRDQLTLDNHVGPLRALAFSRDGRFLASSSEPSPRRGEVFLWDAGR
jgi:eukaryotic-like serine/threonine-protein kinase